jgi:hypothetical protein
MSTLKKGMNSREKKMKEKLNLIIKTGTLILIAGCMWLIKDLTSVVKKNTEEIEWLVNFHILEMKRETGSLDYDRQTYYKNEESQDGN